MMLFFIQIYRNWLIGKFDIIAYLIAENLALRQQIIVLKRNQNRPHIKERDRMFWRVLSNIWPSWRDSLVIVQPETVISWHRKAFRLYWRHKSRGGGRGRPRLDAEVKSLVLKLSSANPLWGATSAAPRGYMASCWNWELRYQNDQCPGSFAEIILNLPLKPGRCLSRITCLTWLRWIF